MSRKILIVAEHDGAKLNPSTAKSVTCARGIQGAEIIVAVFAAQRRRSCRSGCAARRCHKSALPLKIPRTNIALAAVLAPQVVALAKDATHVFGRVNYLRQRPDAARCRPARHGSNQ